MQQSHLETCAETKHVAAHRSSYRKSKTVPNFRVFFKPRLALKSKPKLLNSGVILNKVVQAYKNIFPEIFCKLEINYLEMPKNGETE